MRQHPCPITSSPERPDHMAAKKSVGTKSQKSKVVRVNLSIGEEESQLLFIRAMTSGRSAGEIITSIIASKVRE